MYAIICMCEWWRNKKNNLFAYLSKTNTVNNELITHSGGKDGKDIVGNDPSLSVSFWKFLLSNVCKYFTY